MRPELSKKNDYWIDRNRYYELKYFCLQYPSWKKVYNSIDGYSSHTYNLVQTSTNASSNQTLQYIERRLLYFERMKIVEQTAINTDPNLASYILKAVTEGLSYANLESRLEIPCGRDTYYKRYRRFFWLLDQART